MAKGASSRLSPLVRFVATGAFTGYAPIAPGTVGSFACAVLLWFVLPGITLASSPLAIFGLLVSVLAFIAMSIWAADIAEQVYGKDSSRIVIDEFSGYLVAVALLPKSAFVFIAAFLLFRVIDIVKPFPARRMETIPGGPGVVLDDVVAGLYANILIRIMLLAKGW